MSSAASAVMAGDRPPPEREQKEFRLVEAAAYLGMATQTLYNLIHNGEAPRRAKRRGRWVFFKADLDQWKRDNTRIENAYEKPMAVSLEGE